MFVLYEDKKVSQFKRLFKVDIGHLGGIYLCDVNVF